MTSLAVLFVHIHLGNHRADLFPESQGRRNISSGGTRLPWRLPWLQEDSHSVRHGNGWPFQGLVPAHPSSTAGGQPLLEKCTEPQHLADSLIHGTVCLIAVSLVLKPRTLACWRRVMPSHGCQRPLHDGRE